ncbi:ParA family protein [Halobacillus trueperi]|uniref:ParA family protein n=1 Tax=Halobacillus trueperi TaxID=156205 RepID=A0A3D8VQ01_9BACI|nr:ParA family protein [Halobacillus trueperi]RDY70868.1 ParA family protein [Halobacillus trueperi]
MKILLMGNYKGGCGKTTSNFILSHQLVEKGYKVLFIDFDPQCSGTRMLTSGSIVDGMDHNNIFSAIEEDDITSNIIPINEHLHMVAGSEYINQFERIMEGKGIIERRYLYFRSLMSQLIEKRDYDYILLDMSPSKSSLNTAVMAVATHHIVITQAEILSMEMTKNYIEDIEELQEAGIDSKISGVTIGMMNNTKLSNKVEKALREHYGPMVFQVKTKRKSRIHEFSVLGYPEKNTRGMYYAADSNALFYHQKLTNEIIGTLERATEVES